MVLHASCVENLLNRGQCNSVTGNPGTLSSIEIRCEANGGIPAKIK